MPTRKTAITLLLVLLYAGCNNVENDELWREKIILEDGSHIMVFHSSNCSQKKPFFVNTEKKIDFKKYKYDVFDFCISEEEASMLNVISGRNINKAKEMEYLYADDEQERSFSKLKEQLYDSTDRTYSIYFSLKGDELIPIKAENRDWRELK